MWSFILMNIYQAYSYPTYNSSSAILLYNPNNYYCKAVFSPFNAVIYYYNLEFSAF